MSKKFWSKYNNSLINRGSFSIWISQNIYSQWLSKYHPRRKGPKEL